MAETIIRFCAIHYYYIIIIIIIIINTDTDIKHAAKIINCVVNVFNGSIMEVIVETLKLFFPPLQIISVP